MAHLTHLHVENYKSLKNADLPLGSFNCLIGPNNVGKSSILEAIRHLGKSGSIASDLYFDAAKPIVIRAAIQVETADLDAITHADHRNRLAEILIDRQLTLTATYHLEKKQVLTCTKRVPQDTRLTEARLKEVLKGQSGAPMLKAAAIGLIPELEPLINAAEPVPSTQAAMCEILDAYVSSLSPDQFEISHTEPLPTGIAASVQALIPDIIYIPAVQDAKAITGTADKATFGQILGFLLSAVEPELAALQEALAGVRPMLSRTTNGDGKEEDRRLERVKQMERAIEGHLQESFPDATVKVNIPAPEVKQVLQGGNIRIHDGAVENDIANHGEGLQRATIFSLMRAHHDLQRDPAWGAETNRASAMLMFEEPETFLHPQAQRVLFDALHGISGTNQIIVTTHSPLFLSGNRTTGFSRLSKKPDETGKPHAVVKSIDLTQLDIRTEFQVLCFENNNVAFFADRVVLVEGDSDRIALHYLAKRLNPEWDFEDGSVRIVTIGGKGNIPRFRTFFQKFGIETVVVTDLDILNDGFNHLGLPEGHEARGAHSQLMQKVKAVAEDPDPTAESAKTTWKEDGNTLRDIIQAVKKGEAISDEHDAALNRMDLRLGRARMERKALTSHPELEVAKGKLLAMLRSEGIIVWSRGAIETFYPDFLTGEKLDKARDLHALDLSVSQIRILSPLPAGDDSGSASELDAAVARIFEYVAPESKDAEEPIAAQLQASARLQLAQRDLASHGALAQPLDALNVERC